MFIYGILIALLLFSIYVITIYNTILTSQIQARELWSKLETALKQRQALVSELIAILNQKNKLTGNVMTARNLAGSINGNTVRKEQYENMLSGALKFLLEMSDNTTPAYVLQTQKIQAAEHKIQEILTEYNLTVAHFNQTIKIFPNNLIIHHTHIEPERPFNFEGSSKENKSEKIEKSLNN